MIKISDASKLTVSDQKQIFYAGKKIGKLGGRTLFYVNPKDNTLQYHNFSWLGRILHHFCGYKKKFHQHEVIIDWLVSKGSSNTALKIASLVKTTQAAESQKKQFERLLLSENSTSEEIIQLFKMGMGVNTILDPKSNYTVLHEACARGRFEVAKYLIESGANINAISRNSGWGSTTPLQFAILVRYDKLTLFLLENGADVNTHYANESTVLHETLSQLDSKGRGFFSPEKPRGYKPDTKQIIQQLLLKGANVTATDRNGKTPLHIACTMGDTEVTQWLVKKGADVNAVDSTGRTPLHEACQKGDLEMVKWLVDGGAKIETQYDGRTPAELARASFHQNIFEYLEKLK